MTRVLIVDDDTALCKMVGMTLAHEGYEIETAYDGPSALQLAESWKPHLVLLDVMMPHMDGFEVLSRMRQIDTTMTVPIIMLTAKSSIQDKTIGFKGGADDYIVKPFNHSELRLRIEAHIRRFRLSSEEALYVPDHVIKVPIVLGRHRSGVFRRGYQISKRLFDIAVCLAALPFALPLMALITIAVLLDSPGRAVFVQERTGLSGRRFKMFKFRTMKKDAEALKARYAHLNELTWPDFKITDDPRITRVGKFLRRTSLDELPQIFNILGGDMSLVGPRPTSFSADTYQLWHTERLEVRPGLTGLWQVRGRSDIDFDERVELDIEYIERQSWQLDLMIIFHTVSAVLMGRGAH